MTHKAGIAIVDGQKAGSYPLSKSIIINDAEDNMKKTLCLLFLSVLCLSCQIRYTVKPVTLSNTYDSGPNPIKTGFLSIGNQTDGSYVLGTAKEILDVDHQIHIQISDELCSNLKRLNMFGDIERVPYDSGEVDRLQESLAQKYDAVFVGKLMDYKISGGPYVSTLINPVNALTFLGVESARGFFEGGITIDLKLVDIKTMQPIWEYEKQRFQYENDSIYCSIYNIKSTALEVNQDMVEKFIKDICDSVADQTKSGTIMARYNNSENFSHYLSTEKVSQYNPNDFGRYHALIIGIDQYRDLPKLQTAVADAKDIAKLLEEDYGFDANVLLDPGRADILAALARYRQQLTADDNLLIYYAGHGWLDQDADQGYWLPADASQTNKAAWISNTDISSELRAIQAKHVMVIADSCYSGKLVRGVHIQHMTPDYLIQMARKKARVVLSSGGLEPVLDSGGKNGHSVFTSELLDILATNHSVIDGTTLFTKLRRPVMLQADQTPEYADIRKAGHDGGDFLFIHKSALTKK